MKRMALTWLVLTGALLVPLLFPAAGLGPISCPRDGLRAGRGSYPAPPPPSPPPRAPPARGGGGLPGSRAEGGAHRGRGAADGSCRGGVRGGVNSANRRFVVDETIGAVVAFCTFGAGNAAGGSGAPDTHLFRVENGKLRYV